MSDHPLKATMETWLASGDPVKVAHATARLARGFAPPPPRAAAPRPGPPGLAARAASFAKAVVTHVAAGRPTLSPEAAAARLAVCNGPPGGPPCPSRDPDRESCRNCGCTMLRLKAGWADQDCPEGLWPPAPVVSPPGDAPAGTR